MSDREAFLAGDRPDDVLMYFAEDAVEGVDALADHGEPVDGGVVLVVDGEDGRLAFQSATGVDPMGFAREAMGTDGEVSPDCTGGVCPSSVDGDSAAGDDAVDAAGGDEPHDARFVFAFAEEQNEEVEGLYREGDVVHAYVTCSCGESYSDKWLAGDR